MAVKYSICMVNYNMADTLDLSVGSVASQLDERFEVVLVDDGSDDDSVSIMNSLALRHPIIRVIPLRRDRHRKLGETRNVSVREARGVYCLLHLDCDDVYDGYIKPWIEVFHQIEESVGADILLSGRHIQMAKRNLLLSQGPYMNISRGEDRNMYTRFAAQGNLWVLDHVDFATRQAKTASDRFRRALVHTIDTMMTNFRFGTTVGEFLHSELRRAKQQSLRLTAFRVTIMPFIWLIANFKPPLRNEGGLKWNPDFIEYRKAHTGTFEELLHRHGSKPDWSRFSADSRPIFDVKRSLYL